MSLGSLILVFTSIVDTIPLLLSATKAVLPFGVTATPFGLVPTGMLSGFLAPVVILIADTVLLTELVRKAVVLLGVNATSSPGIPMSVGFLILDFTLIIATGSPVTKAVLPSGVTRTLIGVPPTGISVGFWSRSSPQSSPPNWRRARTPRRGWRG